MLGAIIGDIVGSIYEFNNIKTKDFPLFSEDKYFTDDTVMTIAVYEALKQCGGDWSKLRENTISQMKKYGKTYHNSKISYGNRFFDWIWSMTSEPYNSFGNGCAMRVSPVAYFAKSYGECIELSRAVTDVTHNHQEGIKGAEAVAICVYLALNGYSKEFIGEVIYKNYYPLGFRYDDLVANYRFSEICQNTVPQAIYCFLISEDFEDAIRIAVSIGGDTDTICAITGAIAEAYYGIPDEIKSKVWDFLDSKFSNIVKEFYK